MTGLVLLPILVLLLLALCALAAAVAMSAATGLAIATGNLANQLAIGLLTLALVVLVPVAAIAAFRHGRLAEYVARVRGEREPDRFAKRSALVLHAPALEQDVALPKEPTIRQPPQPRTEHVPRVVRRRVTASAAARHGARLARRWFS